MYLCGFQCPDLMPQASSTLGLPDSYTHHLMDPAGDSGRTKGVETDYDLSVKSRAQVCTVQTDLFSCMWRGAGKGIMGNRSSYMVYIKHMLIGLSVQVSESLSKAADCPAVAALIYDLINLQLQFKFPEYCLSVSIGRRQINFINYTRS